MTKLNTTYKSFFEFLSANNVPLILSIDEALYGAERRHASIDHNNRRHEPYPNFRHPYRRQIKGAFQPVADMWKDFVDTFKPYKSWKAYAFFDLLQPFKGLGNIFKGVVSIVGAIGYFVGATVLNTRNSYNSRRYESIDDLGGHRFLPTLRRDSVFALSWIIEGTSSIVRGAAQIVTAPLTLLRIPFRLLLTGIRTAIWGSPKIEENKGIQRLVSRYQATPFAEVRLSTVYDLHRKYEKALHRYQTTNLDRHEEQRLFNAVVENPMDSGHNYVAFFRTAMPNTQADSNQSNVLTIEPFSRPIDPL